jgi:hypothetical protein
VYPDLPPPLLPLGSRPRGNLAEVEEAITALADLNAFVKTVEDDEFTLMHLAVLNSHHDSVQV